MEEIKKEQEIEIKKKIFKLSEIPSDEKIYLTKNIFGWKIVKPVRNEDGSFNWLNLLVGGWANLGMLIFLLLLVLFFFLAIKESNSQLSNCLYEMAKTTAPNILNITIP